MSKRYARPIDYKPEPCFYCGALVRATMAPISISPGVVEYVLAAKSCTARCAERDPDGYEKALT